MKHHDIEQMDPELAVLFETANAGSPPPGAKARVRARLRMAIAAGGAAAGVGVAAGYAVAKASTTLAVTKSWLLVGTVAVAGALGGFAIHRWQAPSDAAVFQPPSPHPAAPVVDPPAVGPSALSKEHELLRRARRALLQNETAVARAALAEHERSFPRGVLEEERLTLHILTLAKSGDFAQARVQATRFRRQFPGSIQLVTIDQAVAGAR